MENDIIALDLFAGTGWGVACQRLGIEERGVELMEEAISTRTANGMETVYRDVWDGLLLSREMHEMLYGIYTLLIASPPCQTFSLAGRGAGLAALNEVIEAIRLHAYKDPQALLEFGEKHDMRTALVLTPLAYVYRDRPQYVALEQVPTVLPVWEACAQVMRQWGYDVKVAVLQAEQYGVPQTRKRAILVARLDGPVALPVPTHSKYYPSNPGKLDPGVLPWVSMAEALGWGMTARPYLTVTGGGDRDSSKHVGDPAPSALGSKAARERVASEREAGRFTYPDAPDRQLTTPGGELKLLVDELAALQTYPTGWGFTNRPAPTVTGHGLVTRSPTGQKQALVSAVEHGEFTFRPPYTPESAGQDGYVAREDGYIALSDKYHPDAVNCTPEENAVLQTYEPPFVWCGKRSKQFLQIGNAVPPLLAQRVLEALTQEQLI